MKTLLMQIFSVCLLTIGVVYAHSGATGIVKERMDAMKEMGDKAKVVADMLKGKTEFQHDALIDAADAYLLHGTGMSKLFPDTKASRTGSKTEALPEIWNDWDDFQARISEFVLKSEALVETVAKTKDMKTLKNAFYLSSKDCSGCHKLYRKPKE